MEIDCLQRNGTFKSQITLGRHNASSKLNYYFLSDPSHFSWTSTFNLQWTVSKLHYQSKIPLPSSFHQLTQTKIHTVIWGQFSISVKGGGGHSLLSCSILKTLGMSIPSIFTFFLPDVWVLLPPLPGPPEPTQPAAKPTSAREKNGLYYCLS